MKILLADDQRLFVENLKTVLEHLDGNLEVVATAENGERAVDLALEHRPDLVLMDVRMPIMDGVEATRRIHAADPGIAILVLTTFDDDTYVHDALSYGAVGYLLKNIPSEKLLESIHGVLAGTVQLSPDIVPHLVDRPVRREGEDAFPIEKLSRREREVLFLMSRGYDNPSIAERLYLSEQTVKNHISHIYRKLGIHERIAVMQAASDSRLKDYCSHLMDL
jgi:DNA-binding NarL/FixJ family response regulator